MGGHRSFATGAGDSPKGNLQTDTKSYLDKEGLLYLLVTFPFLSKGAQRSLESFGSSSSSSSLFHVS